jgi:hypothetical protein
MRQSDIWSAVASSENPIARRSNSRALRRARWEQLGHEIPCFRPLFCTLSSVRATESSGVMVGTVGIEQNALTLLRSYKRVGVVQEGAGAFTTDVLPAWKFLLPTFLPTDFCQVYVRQYTAPLGSWVPVPRDITAVHTRRSTSTRRALYVEKHEYPASPTTPLPRACPQVGFPCAICPTSLRMFSGSRR